MDDSCFVYSHIKFLLKNCVFWSFLQRTRSIRRKREEEEEYPNLSIMHHCICSHSLFIVGGPIMIDSDFNVENHITIINWIYLQSLIWQWNSCASDMKMKDIFIESVVLCFILNQRAVIFWFIDAFLSMDIKSYLIYEQDKTSRLLR